ncbi:MAG TPA: class I SAM-dependent methyltransferase [Aliidongia sp.]|nr:class I SAM-dependent methyltransferase [Aliidongia sp.]
MEYGQYFEYRRISPADYVEFRIPKYLRSTLSAVKSPRILDFGCGFGQILLGLRADGFENVEGLDISQPAIDFCRSQGLVCHDGGDEAIFGQSKGQYDFVILSHVIEHIEKSEIISVLAKVLSLLKPGGGLIVMVPNAQSNTGCYWAYEDFTHHTMFTSGSLYYVLRSAGFSDVEFLDVDAIGEVSGFFKKLIKKALLNIYRANYVFWNRVTSSSIHKPSPMIFGYEIKALARR